MGLDHFLVLSLKMDDRRDEMIGNYFFPSGSQFSKNKENYKYFLIISAKLNIRDKKNLKKE